MASTFYTSAKALLWGAGINWGSADIRAVLVETSGGSAYTVNAATHDFLNDVAAGSRLATSASMTGRSISGAYLIADNVTFATVAAGALVGRALILYIHTGVESTSSLICYIDTATGLPVTPNGEDITVRWTSNRVISL
jgi:hypothetical protein